MTLEGLFGFAVVAAIVYGIYFLAQRAKAKRADKGSGTAGSPSRDRNKF